MRRVLVVVVMVGASLVATSLAHALTDKTSCADGKVCVWPQKNFGGDPVAYGSGNVDKCIEVAFRSLKNRFTGCKATAFKNQNCETNEYGDPNYIISEHRPWEGAG